MTDKPTVIELLARVMADVQPVGKDSKNTEQNYRFRGIDAVVNEVGPVLRKHGVIVVPELLEASYRDVTTSKGKPSRECTVRVRYGFYGPAGDHIDAVVPGESMDVGDKGAPKAMSVAYRIALLQALCIPTGDPDPDSQSYERGRDEETTGSPAAIDLFAAIVEAKTTTALRAAWEGVRDAKDEGRINQREAVQLNNHVKRRQTEVSDDSTSDGDGGGAESGAPGAGPGPDGQRPAERGPGGNEAAGGVRPGVQHGLRERGGGSGAAQASGRDGGVATAGAGRRE